MRRAGHAAGPLRPGRPGVVQGVGFRPFVYVTAGELGLDRLGGQRRRRRGGRGRGRPADDVTRSAAGWSTTRRRWPMVEARHETELPRGGGTGFTHRAPAQAAAGPHPRLPRRRDLRRLPGASSPTRPTAATGTRSSPAPTAARASRSSPRCPTTAPPPRWPAFAMCDACAAEYDDPADRRFHAQPIACPDCGPTLELVGPGRDATRRRRRRGRARQLLAAGADRRRQGARRLPPRLRRPQRRRPSRELRRRKRRGDKPFAVMVADLGVAAAAGRRSSDDERRAARPGRAADRAARPASRAAAHGVGGGGRAGQPRPRRDAALHAAARAAARARTASPARTSLVMTSGNLVRRADRHRRRRGADPAGAARRRLAAPRPARSTCPATTR